MVSCAQLLSTGKQTMNEPGNPAESYNQPLYGPWTPSQLLSHAFAMYRERPRIVFGLVAIMAAVQIIAIGVMTAPIAAVGHASGGMNSAQFVLPLMGTALLAGLLFFLVSQVMHGAYFYAVTAWLDQREISIGDACSLALGRIGSLVSVALQVALRTFGYSVLAGLVAAVLMASSFMLVHGLFGGAPHSTPPLALALRMLPFILLAAVAFLAFIFWVAGRYAISIPSCLAEGLPGSAAIRRSITLSSKSRGRIYAMYAVLIGISIVNVAVTAPLRFLAGLHEGATTAAAMLLDAIASAANLFFGAWVISLAGIAVTLCYYDLRVRKENFCAPQTGEAAPMAASLLDDTPGAGPSYEI
jgi:hypothetical protein